MAYNKALSTAIKRGDEWVYENPKRDLLPKRQDGAPDVLA